MIRTTARRSVTLVEMDRHSKRNALDIEHLAGIRGAVEKAADDGTRVVVITGRGTSFSGGADLDGVYGANFRDALYGTLGAITSSPVPVVAAVNGPAIGAGTQLAIACDLRVAAPDAVFAVPTGRNGLAVDPWTVRRLALLAGGGPARALLLGAASFTAQQAAAFGLTERLGDLDDAMAWAEEMSNLAPLTLSYSKRALEAAFEPAAWPADIDAEFLRCWDSDDAAEARRARTEKRSPVFQGR
ncbi:enoyl-CoA hydratase [Georgenia sp. Z1491]|uniref:enoyl-CoA hydratase n=1 Tax=Georgenia sp. Z1491 TaxID=3416707 RepID=UPI003CF80288